MACPGGAHVDMGGACDGTTDGVSGSGYTRITAENLANNAGWLTCACVDGATGTSGSNQWHVGAFTIDGDPDFDCEDGATINGFAAGNNTFNAPGDFTAFHTNAGDYAGEHHSSGSTKKLFAEAAFNEWYVAGNKADPCVDNVTYTDGLNQEHTWWFEGQEDQPTTIPPTSTAPTSAAPTTAAPTTAAPTSAAPTSAAPTSTAPTTAAPTSAAPTTAAPTSAAPTSTAPTSAAPTTAAPTSAAPTTAAPTTAAPTSAAPTSAAPTTAAPTSAAPTTAAPTTAAPTTGAPTTAAPTSAAPTTAAPTTAAPTTAPPCPTNCSSCPDCVWVSVTGLTGTCDDSSEHCTWWNTNSPFKCEGGQADCKWEYTNGLYTIEVYCTDPGTTWYIDLKHDDILCARWTKEATEDAASCWGLFPFDVFRDADIDKWKDADIDIFVDED